MSDHTYNIKILFDTSITGWNLDYKIISQYLMAFPHIKIENDGWHGMALRSIDFDTGLSPLLLISASTSMASLTLDTPLMSPALSPPPFSPSMLQRLDRQLNPFQFN